MNSINTRIFNVVGLRFPETPREACQNVCRNLMHCIKITKIVTSTGLGLLGSTLRHNGCYVDPYLNMDRSSKGLSIFVVNELVDDRLLETRGNNDYPKKMCLSWSLILAICSGLIGTYELVKIIRQLRKQKQTCNALLRNIMLDGIALSASSLSVLTNTILSECSYNMRNLLPNKMYDCLPVMEELSSLLYFTYAGVSVFVGVCTLSSKKERTVAHRVIFRDNVSLIQSMGSASEASFMSILPQEALNLEKEPVLMKE
ncbi:hypothetical protein CLAVI_000257 [Candidatus Clavichlamydia salmonicola]|uniref:hypothetical protein n=1 Tax=Candidatus Clavichlamydia salmonicola TaxID=469812 RepID=UPI00189175C2|nr:hypothetical protein [Candidatus Clavichlamydia salmonicola]MBF5050643.1 hypothetical protein [Candidatus Clavichlamydia salmonicola]